jgi:asparagine synthetase B (glutamine-hydrolysing)
VEELRRLLEDSVAAHLVADVPISTFLSGGLDSSLLTVLATRHNRDIDCYTISFRPDDRRLEAMPDDLASAHKLAGQHGIRLHEVETAPDVGDLLPRMVQMLDEPIGDAAAINTYLICRAARRAGVKELLSGMGADELFGATASTTPGCAPPATAACPASYATGSSRRRSSGCRWPAGVAATGRRAGPSASWPSRTCPRRRRSAAATPTTASPKPPKVRKERVRKPPAVPKARKEPEVRKERVPKPPKVRRKTVGARWRRASSPRRRIGGSPWCPHATRGADRSDGRRARGGDWRDSRPLGRLRHEYRRNGDRCHNRRTVIFRLWSSR